jgi:hypothetical protein
MGRGLLMSGNIGYVPGHHTYCSCQVCQYNWQGQQQASPQQINQLYGAQLGNYAGLQQMAQQLNPGPVAGDVDHMKVAEKVEEEPLEIEYQPNMKHFWRICKAVIRAMTGCHVKD